MKMKENHYDSSRNNNFNILMFIAVVFVIIGHMRYTQELFRSLFMERL